MGDAPATAIATFNVLPEMAGGHFMKLECFCFQESPLKVGETMEARVVFSIDPAIGPQPPAAKDVKVAHLARMTNDS